MRRLLIIFLLAMLPLQSSWAAVCAYCPDQCASEVVAAPAAQEPADDDCTHCHVGGTGLPAAGAAPPPIEPPAMNMAGMLAAANLSRLCERPERPNWRRAA